MFHVAGKVAAFYFKAIDFKGCLDSVCVCFLLKIFILFLSFFSHYQIDHYIFNT